MIALQCARTFRAFLHVLNLSLYFADQRLVSLVLDNGSIFGALQGKIVHAVRDDADYQPLAILLVQQVVAPVRWAETMAYLVENGVDTIVEIGPGTVLSGLAKREMRPAKSINLDKLADVQAFAVAGVK